MWDLIVSVPDHCLSFYFGYLVSAVTVHLLLFLFECHGNKKYVRALACVRACVSTYLYV